MSARTLKFALGHGERAKLQSVLCLVGREDIASPLLETGAVRLIGMAVVDAERGGRSWDIRLPVQLADPLRPGVRT